MLIQTLFYIFAVLTVGSAVMVITQNNPVRCVLFLVLTFFCSAVLWMLVEAEFLALILVLVYVGAVMTLFLFVVMMLDIDLETKQTHLMRYLPFGLILVALFIGLTMAALPAGTFKDNTLHPAEHVIRAAGKTLNSAENVTQAASEPQSNTEALGMVLYTDYFLAFELAAVILLSAIVVAITLAHRGAVLSKKQNVIEQIMTQAKDRVELISMHVEK